MKVVLPDNSELELPDGATGGDAAAAIGPKLAEQAVLLRSDGHVQDLRLPLEDGQQIQILTTRDKDDPDALYVLRHSTAHLLAEAVRRLYPGVKIAIGPPIENGFYYDFQFPEPISDADLERIEDEVRREIKEGREWQREEISRDDARRRFESEGEQYQLEEMRRRENARRGYLEVKTPLIYDKVLWERSGHWEKFRENMFLIPEDDHLFAIKPMNCPGHMVLFADKLRSYRELPLRYAEAAPLHRNEPSGTLHGLTRVRHVTQDDAHIFCTREQIEDEIFACLDYAKWIYDLFELESSFELSTRPDNKLGTDEEWDFTEGALRAALDRRGVDYYIGAGEGAFYGPKIDLHMTDSLGRAWQMGTIQLDSQQPARLGCTYVGADNAEHVPYVVHRALYGSFERFIGILTEHYAGAFPFWIAPVQVRVIPVGERFRDLAEEVARWLGGYRVEGDASDETVG